MIEVYEALLIVAVCAILVFGLMSLKRRLLLPLRVGDDVTLQIVVTAKGSANELEHTLKSARWLGDCCGGKTEIIIQDKGLEKEARRVAELFMIKYGNVIYRRVPDGEASWKQSSNTAE